MVFVAGVFWGLVLMIMGVMAVILGLAMIVYWGFGKFDKHELVVSILMLIILSGSGVISVYYGLTSFIPGGWGYMEMSFELI
jgi:hypothetical protein